MRNLSWGVPAVGLALLLGVAPASVAAEGTIVKAELGTGKTEKFEIVNPTTEFRPDTAEIVCVWKSEGVKTGTSVRGVWIAEDVGDVAPPNFKIDEATLASSTGTAGSFNLTRPNKGFPVGKYRVEIYLGKELAKTVPFTVKAR